MIADDDLYSLILLEKVLKKVYKDIVVTRDGEEALRKLITDPEITIALLDILMPKLNGYEVVQKANLVRSNIIFIAFTADIARFDRNKCNELGFYTYLSKPVFPIKILNTINEVLLHRDKLIRSV